MALEMVPMGGKGTSLAVASAARRMNRSYRVATIVKKANRPSRALFEAKEYKSCSCGKSKASH